MSTPLRTDYRTLSIVLFVLGLVGSQSLMVLHAAHVVETSWVFLVVTGAVNVLHGLELYLRLRAPGGPPAPPPGLNPDKA